ncbi:MAG: hypothetical protein V4541_13215 [Bacteroidota bacterium]
MRIQDDFHLTYAVVFEDCHSFCVWLDEKTAKWCYSKYASIDPVVLDHIIDEINILHTPN